MESHTTSGEVSKLMMIVINNVDYDYNNDDSNGSGSANIDEISREKQKPSIDISAVPVASPVVMEQLVTTCGAVIVGFVS